MLKTYFCYQISKTPSFVTTEHGYVKNMTSWRVYFTTSSLLSISLHFKTALYDFMSYFLTIDQESKSFLRCSYFQDCVMLRSQKRKPRTLHEVLNYSTEYLLSDNIISFGLLYMMSKSQFPSTKTLCNIRTEIRK